MYKTKQNYLSFKNHEIFTDKFKQYPKEQQATYWYNIWYILNIMEGCLSVIDFEHHNAGKKLVNKWLELWPYKAKPNFAQRVPTLIDGVDYITFQPNTIVYAVPSDSKLASAMTSAQLGIVFHTSNSGKTMKSLKAGFGTVSGRSGISSVFFADAAYRDVSGSAKLTKSELSSFDARIRMAEGSLLKAGPMLDTMAKTDSLSVGFRLKTFFNFLTSTELIKFLASS